MLQLPVGFDIKGSVKSPTDTHNYTFDHNSVTFTFDNYPELVEILGPEPCQKLISTAELDSNQ